MLREAAAELPATGGASAATKIRKRCVGRPPEGRRRRHRRVAVREQREGEEDVGVVVEPARPLRPR